LIENLSLFTANMNNKEIGLLFIMFGVVTICTLYPELSFAQNWGGSGFESRLNGLTSGLINVVLPAVSILGLVYAAILAATGDAAAKSRMVLVIIASVVGFLAPIIINWFKSASGV